MRFGLPLMVLTSLSLHLILLLIWMLAPGRGSNVGTGNAGPIPGPVVIISKEISPERPPASLPPPSPPPPRLPAVVNQAEPKPAPSPILSSPPDVIMAGNSGPRLSGGVVFVLDISGSMYEAYAGATRLALARKFIDREIASLPDGTPFAIALYGESTRRSGLLVRANNATREAAQRYLAEDFDCGGGTNLPAGLDTAAELHPASVVLVTDGDLNIANDKLMAESRRILGSPGPHLAVFAIAPRHNTDAEELLAHLVHQQSGTYQAMDVKTNRGTTEAPMTGPH